MSHRINSDTFADGQTDLAVNHLLTIFARWRLAFVNVNGAVPSTVSGITRASVGASVVDTFSCSGNRSLRVGAISKIARSQNITQGLNRTTIMIPFCFRLSPPRTYHEYKERNYSRHSQWYSCLQRIQDHICKCSCLFHQCNGLRMKTKCNINCSKLVHYKGRGKKNYADFTLFLNLNLQVSGFAGIFTFLNRILLIAYLVV